MSAFTRDQKVALLGLGVTIVGTLSAVVVVPEIRKASCRGGGVLCDDERDDSLRRSAEERTVVEAKRLAPVQPEPAGSASAEALDSAERRAAPSGSKAETQQADEQAKQYVRRRAKQARLEEEARQAEEEARHSVRRRADQARRAEAEAVLLAEEENEARRSGLFFNTENRLAEPRIPAIAGTYRLQSFTLGGVPLVVTGAMTVTQISSSAFKYDATAFNFHNNAHVYYRGLYRKQPTHWTAVTHESNDPLLPASAYVEGPIVVDFDGSNLRITSGPASSAWAR